MRLVLAAVLVTGTTACEPDNTPVCRPATTADCYCYTGAPGEKTCRADGLGFEECACLPDAGVDAAPASPDAGAPDGGPDAGPPGDAAPR